MKSLEFEGASMMKINHKRKNCGILAVFLLVCGQAGIVTSLSAQHYFNTYGAITDLDSKTVKGGFLEKVVIYPQLESGSAKRIIRKGVLTRFDDAQATILMCHGFMCDKFDIGILRRLFRP